MTRALILAIAPRDRPFTSTLIRRAHPEIPVSTIGSALLRMVMDGEATRERGAFGWRYTLHVPATCNTDGV